jgi:hypothetical protein
MVVVTIAIMTARGFLPTYHLLHFGWWSPWCQVVGSGVFLLVLFCWQEVGRLSTCRGQLLFLDRACINQLDDDLKQRGIEHLAAFVYYSWSMLICYSDEYLQRLWTVYEVASFLMLHPGSALHVRHAFFAKFIISGVALVFVELTSLGRRRKFHSDCGVDGACIGCNVDHDADHGEDTGEDI